MKSVLLKIQVVVILMLLALPAFAERWYVSDDYLTVWDSPEYLHSYGKIERGYEFEVIGRAGDMLIFDYNGHQGYVASYCCRRVVASAPKAPVKPEVSESAPQVTADKPVAKQKKPATAAPVAQNRVEETEEIDEMEIATDYAAAEDGDSETGFLDYFDSKPSFEAVLDANRPGPVMTTVMQIWVLLSIVFLVLALFFSNALQSIFDGLSGSYFFMPNWVSLQTGRPLITLIIFFTSLWLTESLNAALFIAGVYLAIVIAVRSKDEGVRYAIAESIYLGLFLTAFSILAGIMVMLALISLRGDGGGKDKEEEEYLTDQYGRRINGHRMGSTFHGSDGHDYYQSGDSWYRRD